MNITKIANLRQTVLLTSRWQEKDNIITINWYTPLSFQPMMYGVAIAKTRYSLNLIKKSGVFVINFMPKNFKEEALFCGRHCGKNIDKFKKTGLEKENSDSINCPRIKQSMGWLECQVKKEIEVGDSILFLAEITRIKLKKQCKPLLVI